MTHYTFSTLDNEPAMPNVPGREKRDSSKWNFEGEARIFTIFPFFHVRETDLHAPFSPYYVAGLT